MKVTLINYTQNPIETIEEAASTCYNSKPSNGAIMKHCYNSGHHSVLEFADFHFKIEGVSRACYDDKTEVLTDEGWKFFKDLNGKEKILTRNQDGQVEFQNILNQIFYDYEGELHHYKSQNIDLNITPNHKMLIKKYDSRSHKDYFLIPSEDINFNRFYIEKRLQYNPEIQEEICIPGFSYKRKDNQGKVYIKKVPDLILNREKFYKFLAWYLSEGSVYYNSKENSYTISISQIKEKNIQRIIKIIEDCGFKAYYDGVAVRFKSLILGNFLKNLGFSYNKKLPFNLFYNFNQKLANIFIEEYILGDGTTDKNNCSKIYTTSKKLADDLFTLCFIAGYTAKMNKDNRVGQSHILNGKLIQTKHICYVINISKTGRRNHEAVIKKNKHFNKEKYKGKVYCIEVPNHTLFVRREGIAQWCGNCSHQLVRHRLASFAQRSQRYCKEDGFEYVTPETIAENETINKTYTHLMSTIETFYELATTMGIPEEDARFILPNACTTEINVKMNLRELIHFMNERLCTCAQWEIREMAILMREEVLKVCPDLKDMLVPKCEQHNEFPYCPESPKRSCGRHKTISELTKN